MMDQIKRFIENLNTNKDILNKTRGFHGPADKSTDDKKPFYIKIADNFLHRFSGSFEEDTLSFISVPNRVELLGKHTDYQGGHTLIMAGPRNFTAFSALSKDNITCMHNLNKEYGDVVIEHKKSSGTANSQPEIGDAHIILSKGLGWQYTSSVINRISRNLTDSGFPPPGPVKVAFYGDIPIGGGTSGSSAKVIMDFLSIATPQGLMENTAFIKLIEDNGKIAGIRYNQEGVDNFRLALSMYLANFENGFDYGKLRGDRGVGTFGGSEDHTAIMLGEAGKLLYCSYFPTEVIKKVEWPEGYAVVVAYSGIKAEKTGNAKERYNLLSITAGEAVKALNKINGTDFSYLRDFYTDIEPSKRGETAGKQLKENGYRELAGRAYQFFEEEWIISQAVASIAAGEMPKFGELINKSHILSREYLNNIIPEIDYLHRIALKLGAIGATGFGAGFGGSCYSVVNSSDAEGFIENWKREYESMYPEAGRNATFEIYPPCSGAYWKKVYD